MPLVAAACGQQSPGAAPRIQAGGGTSSDAGAPPQRRMQEVALLVTVTGSFSQDDMSQRASVRGDSEYSQEDIGHSDTDDGSEIARQPAHFGTNLEVSIGGRSYVFADETRAAPQIDHDRDTGLYTIVFRYLPLEGQTQSLADENFPGGIDHVRPHLAHVLSRFGLVQAAVTDISISSGGSTQSLYSHPFQRGDWVQSEIAINGATPAG